MSPDLLLSWMVVSMRISPPHSLGTLRVMMLITPPMASDPYSDDIGPRTTSMRSMAEIGGVQPPSTPLESELVRVSREFWRLPSIRISVYSAHAAQADVLAVAAAGDHHARHLDQRVGDVAV